MKKVLAIFICVLMLLTAVSSVPVFAEGEEQVNLVTNGDFEADTAGEDSIADDAENVTEITGWTQVNEANKAILVAREGGSNWIKAYNDSDGGYTGTELTHPAGVKQTVTIDTESDWYTDFRNYKYVLTYDAHMAGSVWRGYVTVIVTGEDGTAETTDVTPSAADYTVNVYNAGITVDLSDAVAKIGRQPVKSIEIILTAEGRWEFQTYDNVAITPVYSPVEEIESFVSDGSFEDMATAEAPVWGFAGGASLESNLMTDDDAFDGDYYVAIDAGQRIDQEMSGDVVKAGNAYLLEFYYMSVEATAFISVETCAGYLKLGELTLPATGTTWDDAKWKPYQFMVVMRECDTKGILIRLRNGAAATNSVFYDCVTLTHVPGYDSTNMIANADFEYGNETYIPNWTQNGSVVMGRGTDRVNTGSYSASVTGYGALQQSVNVDPAYEDGAFDLSFYFNYSAGGGAMPGILVRAYREDGSFTGYTYNACIDMNSDGVLDPATDRGCVETNQSYVDGLHWTVKNGYFYGTINLDKALSKNTDERPVKRFLIQLASTNSGGVYDSIRLTPRKTSIDFVNKDNTIPASISEIKEDKLTVRAKYLGEAEKAMAYFAVYSVTDGEAKLETVNVETIASNGTEVTVDLSGLNLTDEQNIVKVFIWDGNKAPIFTKTLN